MPLHETLEISAPVVPDGASIIRQKGAQKNSFSVGAAGVLTRGAGRSSRLTLSPGRVRVLTYAMVGHRRGTQLTYLLLSFTSSRSLTIITSKYLTTVPEELYNLTGVKS